MPTALYIVNLLPKSSRENQTLVKTNDTFKIHLIFKSMVWYYRTETTKILSDSWENLQSLEIFSDLKFNNSPNMKPYTICGNQNQFF